MLIISLQFLWAKTVSYILICSLWLEEADGGTLFSWASERQGSNHKYF